jgi:hypothetical protein
MTPKEMIFELTTCYIPASAKMIERMEALAESIQEDARQDVIDAIMEKEGPSTKIGTAHIVDACNVLGISYRKAHYIPAVEWTCDACGNRFKYSLAPNDDDYIDKQIYDFCPMCGFQPGWTILHDRFRLQGIATPWYDRQMVAAQKWKPGNGYGHFKNGIFWSRAKAESERSNDRKMAIEAKMESLGKAKRWDLQGGNT